MDNKRETYSFIAPNPYNLRPEQQTKFNYDKPTIIITAGPTGSGKSSLLDKALELLYKHKKTPTFKTFLIDDYVDNSQSYKDIVNNIKPKVILLNAIHDGPIEVVVTKEIPDSTAMSRQVSKSSKCSNLVLSISHTIYKQAMYNMGYECLKTLEYKKNYYAAFQLRND
jgi:energy-coupling factor transporter ATP-binding protein EcfA2